MRQKSREELEQIALDLELELQHLRQLSQDIHKVKTIQATAEPELVDILYENLAYKLQNFYMGCERIFQTVSTELNGSLPSGSHWHKRLLERMAVAIPSRPALISPQTATALRVYLGFRHVSRNIYGFELQFDRVADLVEQYDETWRNFEADILAFINWLKFQDGTQKN